MYNQKEDERKTVVGLRLMLELFLCGTGVCPSVNANSWKHSSPVKQIVFKWNTSLGKVKNTIACDPSVCS